MDKTELKKRFEEVVGEYEKAFLDAYFKESTDHYWVGDKPGTVFYVDDLFFGLEDMRVAVDHDVPFDTLYDWYWYSTDVYNLTDRDVEITLSSYLEGRRPYTKEDLDAMKVLESRRLELIEQADSLTQEIRQKMRINELKNSDD